MTAFTPVKVGGKKPAAQRVGLDKRGPPAASSEACREVCDDLVHRGGVLGGDVEVALRRSTRPWACTAYPPVSTRG